MVNLSRSNCVKDLCLSKAGEVTQNRSFSATFVCLV